MSSRQLPAGFLEMLSSLGLDGLGKALSEGEPCTSVRFNALRGVTAADTDFRGAMVPWCSRGLYLDERPRFTADPMFHQGCYYVQEASSMFHAYIVEQLTKDMTSPIRLLDSCAAPGGKTTAAIDSLPEGSLVVANEYVPSRAAVLRENIIKWGYPSCVVTRGDTMSFRKLKDSFDIVIADVPCSGEGMMRKDEDAVAQWSQGLIRDCAMRQREIIDNLWPSLKPGGHLIYSTCTFNRSENEEMVSHIINELGGESVEIDIDSRWGIAPGIDTEAHCYRFMPGCLRGEGLFVAVIRKAGESRHEKFPQRKDRGDRNKASQQLSEASSWLSADARSEFEVYVSDDRINAFPRIHSDMLRRIKKEIDVIHEGVLIGNIKGKNVVPSQSLALSPLLRPDAFPTCGLDRETALSYLAGEAVCLPDDTPRGLILTTYADRPLGFAKNIGRHSNNLYPTPWRIKSKNLIIS
ncbi:MAG: rRNA cytosine-C5-methyltransferase [Bacteroides sp.]|nr:rRNA cytosine-C5-methyltransferase [Bacteroides sp.]